MGNGDEQSNDLRRSSSSRSANAEARMNFASVDALSELVWSPRNGLRLRCADFSFTGKGKLLSPNFFDDIGVGQTNNMESHSKSLNIEQDEEAGFRVDLVRTDDEANQACNEMNRPLSEVGGSVEDMKPEREEMDEDSKVKTNDDRESEEAETRVGSSKRSLDSPRGIGGETEFLLANEQLRLERAGSQAKTTNLGDKTNDRALDADRLEARDENDLANASKALVACESKGECLPEDETDAEKAGPSGSYGRRVKAKGKEKALSDGTFDGTDDDDDESFESVESCNSAGLLSRGKKRPGFEQQLILGSKRLKTLSQECFGSTSMLKQDSSFMNWISNMTKGIWKGNEEDNSPFVAITATSDANVEVNTIVDQQEMSSRCLKKNSGCRNTGFQSFFQSIYCPKTRVQNAVEMGSSNDANVASLQELPWIPEQCLNTKGDHLSSSGNKVGPVAEPNISSGKVVFNQISETFSSGNKHEDKEPKISLLFLSKSKPSEEQKTWGEADVKVTQCLTNKNSGLESKSKPSAEQKTCGEANEKVTQCITNRNSGLESLWISRFSSKSYFPQKQDPHERITNEAAKEANDSSSDAVKTRDSQNAILPIISSLRIESSEAMASFFARRLEAMKHIMSSGSLAEKAEEGQTNVICFYCGKKGHCLQDCLEVTDTELRDLVHSIRARNRREKASSLCIRCFHLSHWAATCPNAPPYSSGAEDRAMKHALASTSGTKLPFSGFTDVPKAVFDAVQVLRLTRTDVLKWMNTKKSVSGLEGFFLRLRLGKWEERLGGTGYHVARIEGDTEGQSSRKHSVNSSISVKVGGMTCFVESQFISNHDFLEEELMAWWQTVGKSTGRSGGDGDGLPSAEELSRKIQQRKMLGF